MKPSQKARQLARAPLDIVDFTEVFCGIKLSPSQTKWVQNSQRLVNILKPGNQWGKTTVTAIKHIYHAMRKPKLDRFGMSPEAWLKARYETLNFGKTYEVAKAVMGTIIDIVNGEFMILDRETQKTHYNISLLRGAIKHVKEDPLPQITWWNGSTTLIRSYDDLGSSFKTKRLAYISGDEVGDIDRLIEFMNGTLLPRLVFYQGSLDLVGTPQNPNEYQEIVEIAKRGDNPDYYLQEGTMYENPHLSVEHVQRVENIADPQLRRRIIMGEFVDAGDRFFPLIDIINACKENIKYTPAQPWIEEPKKEGRYVVVYDPAASEDNSAIGVLRYDIPWRIDEETISYKIKLIYKKVFKGNSIPLPMQYEMVREIFNKIKDIGAKAHFIYDAHSLGGKNAGQQLSDLRGFGFPGKGRSPIDGKAEALAKLKAKLEENRKVQVIDGREVDRNEDWGGLVLPNYRPLRIELEGYKLDDKKIKNDRVMMLAMGVWYIDRLNPKSHHTAARDFDMFETYIPRPPRKH